MNNQINEVRNLLVRGDNYTNDHDAKYNALHDYMRGHAKAQGQHPYERYGYTKITSDHTDPEHGNHKVWSNSGPSVKRNPQTGKHEFVKDNLIRNKNMSIKTTENAKNVNPATGKSHPMNQYVVANLRRPNAGSQKKQDKTYKTHEAFMNKVKTFRHWGPGQEVAAGDKTPDSHDHPDGHGHMTVTRQTPTATGHVAKKIRYHYQDYDAITPKHDNRASDEERKGGSTKTPEGKKVGLAIVSSAVSSTPKHDLEHSTMFHDTRDLDQHGILHSGHPHAQEEAYHNGIRKD